MNYRVTIHCEACQIENTPNCPTCAAMMPEIKRGLRLLDVVSACEAGLYASSEEATLAMRAALKGEEE